MPDTLFEAEAILICELDGTEEEVLAQIELVESVLKKGGATETRLARDEAERLLFWSGRKAAFPAVGRLSPDYYCIDGTIPRKSLAVVLGVVCVNFLPSMVCGWLMFSMPGMATCTR